MIRNVVMVELEPDHDPVHVRAIQDGFRSLNPPGCVSYTLGDDLGLRDGNWSYAIVADFIDEDAYRAYDLETEHNRLRGELAPYAARIARCQFELPDPEPIDIGESTTDVIRRERDERLEQLLERHEERARPSAGRS